jgi:MFS family permease
VIPSICVCLFIITIEITIVNTSLISIANDLKSFNRSSWIVTAYLLTYVGKDHRQQAAIKRLTLQGLLIISAKLSDILGRKPVLLFSVAAFTLWAGVCGAAQTTNQL